MSTSSLGGERQVVIDCDVLFKRMGEHVAMWRMGFSLKLATNYLLSSGAIKFDPIIGNIAAVSCGIDDGKAILDLNSEDSNAETDANCYERKIGNNRDTVFS